MSALCSPQRLPSFRRGRDGYDLSIGGACNPQGQACFRQPGRAFLARAGLTARGVIYILVGVVAVLVALGQSSREADQSGALQLLAGKSYGLVALWLLGIGFAAYSLWRLSEAAFGVTGEPPGAGPRLKSLARSVIYAGLAYLTFEVISGTGSSQRQRQQDVTGHGHAAPGRPLGSGHRRADCRHLRPGPGHRGRPQEVHEVPADGGDEPRGCAAWIKVLGVTGTIARGLVFALVGVLVVDAAVTHKASESGGIDKALLTLRNQPFGEFLMLVAALGLMVFGVYGLCEARWRKV